MGIDKARKDNSTRAIDLRYPLAILLQPGIAQRVFCAADGNDFAADAKNCCVLENPQFAEFSTSTWS